MRLRSAIAVACFAAFSAAGAADVHLTGHTTADPRVIRDVLRQIATLGNAEVKCATPDAVESEILPEDFPASTRALIPGGKGTFEHWNATMCGQEVHFLITFWPNEKGGTMFAVELFHVGPLSDNGAAKD